MAEPGVGAEEPAQPAGDPADEINRGEGGRFRDGSAIAARWRVAAPVPDLTSLESSQAILAVVARATLKELTAYRRAAKRVPPSLFSAIAKIAEVYLKIHVAIKDDAELAETRQLLREVRARQRRLPSGRVGR